MNCPTCFGKGTKNGQLCPSCGGTGQAPARYIRVPFDYVFPTAALLANQQGLNVPLQFDFDADFEHIFTVANSTGLYSVQLTDTSTGRRQLSNAAVNGENFAGTAALPFPYVEPYLWARSSTCVAQFNDRSGGANNVQLVFRGYKLYPAANPAQGSQGYLVPQS